MVAQLVPKKKKKMEEEECEMHCHASLDKAKPEKITQRIIYFPPPLNKEIIIFFTSIDLVVF